MKKEEIIAAVNGLLAEGFEVDPERLKPEALLAEDLELDSLDAVDLIVAMEKKFGLHIEEGDARAMKTLDDVYGYIVTHLEAKDRAPG